jgi:RNA polymerase sigma-70 factor (ECF subfamily)
MQSIKRWFSKKKESSMLNADGFTRLYEQTYLMIFRYVYGFCGGPQQEAEDLTAETYARAWKQRHHFDGNEQAALGWLLRIARNLAIDLSRRRKVRDVDENISVELLADFNPALEVDIIAREQIAILWKMLGRLSDEAREMLVLRYILGWQIKQVANHLGISENNVSVTIRRTLEGLQRSWPQWQEKDNE